MTTVITRGLIHSYQNINIFHFLKWQYSEQKRRVFEQTITSEINSENRNDEISIRLTDRVVLDAVRLKFHSIGGGAADGYCGDFGAASRDIFLPLLSPLERTSAGIQLSDVPPRPRHFSARPLLWQISGVRIVAEIIFLDLEYARAVGIVEIGRPELPDPREIVRDRPEVLRLRVSFRSVARSPLVASRTFGELVRSSELRPRCALRRSLVLRSSSDLRSGVVAQQVLDVQSSLGGHLLDAVIAMISVAAVRPGAPAHSFVDEVLVVRPAFLHVEVELPAASIFLGSFLGVSNFFSVTLDALLVLVPPAFTDVPLVPVHPRHRKFAQVRARTWLRRARWNFQKIVRWETRKFFPKNPHGFSH